MADTNPTEYAVRIAAKRQVTLPEPIMTALKLRQGDEFRLVMRSPTDIRLVPYMRIRSDLLTPEIEAILNQRRAEIEAGAEMISQEELLKRAAISNAQRRIRELVSQGSAARETKQRIEALLHREDLAKEERLYIKSVLAKTAAKSAKQQISAIAKLPSVGVTRVKEHA
jgi:bifunctional DNA-binding transcriptional regulator/antitoxin component of YhaV-PrlF toxin-antitoxin module